MMERAPQPVREMLALLRESGHAPYLVGGCVRDLLRGAEPDDYDMTSDARPEEVMTIFGADAQHIVPGTVIERVARWRRRIYGFFRLKAMDNG